MIQRIIKQLIPLYSLILISFILTYLFFSYVSLYYNVLSSIVLAFIFLGSTILVNYKIDKNPKRFVGNFLVMTTLQLLSFLSYEVVLILQGGRWWVTLHPLVICIILIVIQSINLARLELESPQERIE